jgi:ABC-type nitrate/sulfonate/bicarbonate transport system permease component
MIWFRRLVAIAVVLAAWEFVAALRIVPDRYLPSVPETLIAFARLWTTPEVLLAEMLTVSRALAGLSLTIPVGIGLAVLAALFRPLRLALLPATELMRPIPPAAIVPISVMFLGFGTRLYLFTIVFVAMWPVYLNTLAALDGAHDVLRQTGRAFGCGRLALTREVVLPQGLPQIFVGIRLAATVSFIATVVTDMLTGRDGIGYLLFQRAFALHIPDVFALTLLCGLDGMLFNQGVRLARHRMVRWHDRMLESNAA